MAPPVPRIVSRSVQSVSPWVSMVGRTLVRFGETREEEFHSLQQADYVSVLALTSDGRVPLVCQYRPALERVTIELPGGLREEGQSPEEAAIRELFEETGMVVTGHPIVLGHLVPDSGRLENRLWGYFARVKSERAESWVPEAGVESFLCPVKELQEWILSGQFDHALHLALIGLAMMRGVFVWGEKDPYEKL